MENILDKIIKYGLYSLAFLLPLFFLPLTVLPTIINKQMLLSVFVFVLLILWVLKIMISGKLNLAWGKLSGGILLLLVILALSTAFFGTRAQSFWGMSFEPDTLFSFILYGLTFFLFANLSHNEVGSRRIIFAFLASSGILSLLFLIQAFWKPIFPWGFAQSSGFNPVGSVQSLGMFLGGAFVILMALSGTEIGSLRKRTEIGSPRERSPYVLPIILGIMLFVSIFIINYWVSWLGLIFAMAIILFWMLKRISINQPKSKEISDMRKFILPLFILAISLTFLIIKIPFGNIVNLPVELSPTHRATFNIATKTLAESPKNLILGSGPATFAYQYNLHRGTGPNLSDFWQIRFEQGATAFLTFLTTFGVLGTLLLLGLIVVFLWQGFKSLISINQPNQYKSAINIAIFTGGFYYLISWFFYPINLSLLFVTFLLLGLYQRSSANPHHFREKVVRGRSVAKEFSFTQSPQKAFLIMLLGIILIVGSIIGIYNVSQKYIAALNYAQGIKIINVLGQEPEALRPSKLNEGIVRINKAAGIDPKDIYFRNLSQAFLIQVNQILSNQALEQEQMQKLFQQAVSNAELSATAAVQVNPQNSQNWTQLANVYENLAFVNVEGAGDLAFLNYQKAAELDPQNPQIPLNIGRVYRATAGRIKVQIALLEAAEKKDEEVINKLKDLSDKNLELALEEFKKSTELKINFSPAYYLMAQVYETRGEKEKALENYLIVLQLEPGNEEIQKKVEELSK